MEKLYVGNIPFEASSEDLSALLGQFGPLVNIEMPRDPAGKMPHRGFAHVTFINEAAAAGCMNMLNGFMFYGRPLKVQPCAPSTRGSRAAPPPMLPRAGFGQREPTISHNYSDAMFASRGPVGGLQPIAQNPPFHMQPQQPAPQVHTVASVRAVVEAMSAAEQYDILATLRSMCDTPGGRDSATELLSTCPSFAHAVLMMEERLGMLQVCAW